MKLEDLIKLVSEKTESKQSIQEQEDLKKVKEDGLNLWHVKNQTEAICLEAVKQNPWALQYVQNQTFEVCCEALKKCPNSFTCIRDREMKELLYKSGKIVLSKVR